MMKRIVRTAFLLTAMLLLAVLFALPAQAETWTWVYDEETLRAAIEDGGYDTIYLGSHIQTNAVLEIGVSKQQTLTLDMQGYNITRKHRTYNSVNGSVIHVCENSKLTIRDSSNERRSTISGGWAKQGASIRNEGTLILEEIILSGNKAEYDTDPSQCQGSAVYNSGTLRINGARIENNDVWSDGPGGAVYNTGTMYFNGGNIRWNKADAGIGGIYNAGTLHLKGSIYCHDNNKADIYLAENKIITIDGAITGDPIGVACASQDLQTRLTSGWNSHNAGAPADQTFFCREAGHTALRDGEVWRVRNISYIERGYDGTQVTETTRTCSDYTLLSTCTDSASLTGGWYIAQGSITFSNRLEISGDVRLILMDGATVTCNGGIHTNTNNGQADLTIYAQQGDSGKLTALEGGNFKASIGGNNFENCGNITIHGGDIYARDNDGGVSIGNGQGTNDTDHCITIYGGTITAISGSAPALGSSQNGGSMRVAIYGGTVQCTGMPAIGIGQNASADGIITLGDEMQVRSPGAPDYNAFTDDRIDYCTTYSVVTILPCEHPDLVPRSLSDEEHAWCCPYCAVVRDQEAHDFSDVQYTPTEHSRECYICSYLDHAEHDFGADNLCACGVKRITLTFDPGVSSGDAYTEDYVTRATYDVPECEFPTPDGMFFGGWAISDRTGRYLEGDEVIFESDVTLTAIWTRMTWQALQNAINEADPLATIQLICDVTATTADGPLVVPMGKNITINMNGYSIDRAIPETAEDGGVFVLDGELTLTSTSSRTSRITGGKTDSAGGGVTVKYGAMFTLDGCEISGNHAGRTGGGVAITGGVFRHLRGEISNNSAEYAGGGVAVVLGSYEVAPTDEGAVWIRDNESNFYGGGVAVLNDSTFEIQGNAQMTGNRSLIIETYGNEMHREDIFLSTDSVITLTGELTTTTPYYVRTKLAPVAGEYVTITSGLRDYGTLDQFMNVREEDTLLLNTYSGEATLAGGMATVRLLPNGAEGLIYEYVVPDGYRLNLPANNYPAPENRHFTGWRKANPQNEEEQVIYKPGEFATVTGDTDFLAQWGMPWKELQKLLNAGGTIHLAGDVVADEDDVALQVPYNVSVDLDLYGSSIDRNLSEAKAEGRVLEVAGKLTIRDTSYGQKGKITGGYVDVGNYEKSCSAMYIAETGTVNLYGGSITENLDHGNGRTGYPCIKVRGRLNMYGGAIRDNGTHYRMMSIEGGQFNMYGGAISGNSTNMDGTIVLSSGSINMSGGSITNNNGYGYHYGTGGIDMLGGTFHMSGGEITDNYGSPSGGIWYQAGRLELSGSPVIENNIGKDNIESDLCMAEGKRIQIVGPISADARIGVCFPNSPGIPKILTNGLPGNGDPNSFISNRSYSIALDANGEAAMGDGVNIRYISEEGPFNQAQLVKAIVGVTYPLPECTFTGPADHLFAGWQIGEVIYDAGETYSFTADTTVKARWATTEWAALQMKLSAAAGKIVMLKDDLHALSSEAALTLAAGKEAILDLNGHTLDRARQNDEDDGSVFVVNGTLTIMDLSPEQTGTITGGKNTDSGGGIYVGKGTLTLLGGHITGNTTSLWGGGIYLDQEATLNLEGGRVTGNTSVNNGAGIHVSERSRITLSGNPVVADNTDGNGLNNVNFASGSYFHVTDVLSESASIAIHTSVTSTLAKPVVVADGLTSDRGSAANFTSDAPGTSFIQTDSGLLLVGAPVILHFSPGEGTGTMDDLITAAGVTITMPENGFTAPAGKRFIGWQIGDLVYDAGERFVVSAETVLSDEATATAIWFDGTAWQELQTRLNGSHGNVIMLTGNATAASDEAALTVPAGRSAILDLNGHTINRNLESLTEDGSVFIVDGALTIRDTSSAHTGTITGGRSNSCGGAVYNNGTLTLESGTYSGNIAETGGAIYNAPGASLTISGGTITRNTSRWEGGGVCSDGDMTMTGGLITDNNCAENLKRGCGAISRSGALNISGSPVVQDNSYDNFYLCSGQKFKITGALDSTAKICFLTQDLPAKNASVTITDGLHGNGSLSNFSSDFSQYPVLTDSWNEAILSVEFGISFTEGEGFNCQVSPITGQYGEEFTMPLWKGTAPDGKTFFGWALRGDVYEGGETCTIFPREGEHIGYLATAIWADTPWNSLQKIIDFSNGNTITLKRDYTATPEDGPLYVRTGQDITIDLNGHTLDRALTAEAGNGSVFCLEKGTLNLRDDSASGNGKLTGAYGGSCVYANGTFNMYGGTITGNTSSSGAGVYVTGSCTFNMYGGTITGNTSSNGAGVCVVNYSTFNMYGGTITGNTSEYGAGVHVGDGYRYGHCTFNMYGGSITENTASYFGGALSGGLHSNVTIFSGTISGNTAGKSGGGLKIGYYANLYIRGGVITGNTAKDNGGGIYLYYTGSNDRPNRASFSGNPIITGNMSTSQNRANNVDLDNADQMIAVDGPLSSSARIGISIVQGHIRQITDGLPGNGTIDNFLTDDTHYEAQLSADGELEFLGSSLDITFAAGEGGSGTMETQTVYEGEVFTVPECGFTAPAGMRFLSWKGDDQQFYSPGDSFKPVKNTNLTAVWINEGSTPWQELQRYIDVGDGMTIKLRADVHAQATDTPLVIPAGKSVTIDLDAHVLDRGLTASTENGNVITVYGSLMVRDSTANASGYITGGNNSGAGGGIRNFGTLYLHSGDIRQNTAQEGGGIWNSGTLTIEACKIQNNTATGDSGKGGGIYNEGSISINGYQYINIESNEPSNLWLSTGTIIDVSGDLSEPSNKIGITTEDKPAADTCVTLTNGLNNRCSAGVFFSDDPDYYTLLDENGEAVLIKDAIMQFTGGSGAGGTMEDLTVTLGQPVTLPECGFTPPTDKYFAGWKIDNGETIYFAGDSFTPHTDSITHRTFTASAVWADSSWSALSQHINSAKTVTVKLTEDVIALPTDTAFEISFGANVTIDLNGYRIDRALTDKKSGGNVFSVSGTLTILDSSEAQTGMITGAKDNGFIYPGGAIRIIFGKVILKGGTIANNVADKGGAVGNNNGEFVFEGGTIRNNTADNKKGGAIYNLGRMIMSGGLIQENRATSGNYSYGGGIYSEGTLILTGGSITNNTASFGGGVYNQGSITVSGSPVISGNHKTYNQASNLYLKDTAKIAINGDLDEDALIGVSTETLPSMINGVTFTSGLGSRSLTHFTSDVKEIGGPKVLVQMTSEGEAELRLENPFGETDFTLPAALTEVDDYAFEGFAAASIFIPDGCTRIGEGAFQDSGNLRKIRLPKNCEIDNTAFAGCHDITFYAPAGGTTETWLADHASDVPNSSYTLLK